MSLRSMEADDAQIMTYVQWCGAPWKSVITRCGTSVTLAGIGRFGASGYIYYAMHFMRNWSKTGQITAEKKSISLFQQKLWKYLGGFHKQIGLGENWSVRQMKCLDRLLQTHVYDKKHVSSRWPPMTHQWTIWSLQAWNNLIFPRDNDATKTKELMESLILTGQNQLSARCGHLRLFAAAQGLENCCRDQKRGLWSVWLHREDLMQP